MKTWTKSEIIDLLNKNDKAVTKALVRLYERQTFDEQATLHTRHTNGRGFNKPDAKFMSSVAEWYITNNFLTPRQLAKVRNKILKYAGQLTSIANGID